MLDVFCDSDDNGGAAGDVAVVDPSLAAESIIELAEDISGSFDSATTDVVDEITCDAAVVDSVEVAVDKPSVVFTSKEIFGDSAASIGEESFEDSVIFKAEGFFEDSSALAAEVSRVYSVELSGETSLTNLAIDSVVF